jgi:hypothetical protein
MKILISHELIKIQKNIDYQGNLILKHIEMTHFGIQNIYHTLN